MDLVFAVVLCLRFASLFAMLICCCRWLFLGCVWLWRGELVLWLTCVGFGVYCYLLQVVVGGLLPGFVRCLLGRV